MALVLALAILAAIALWQNRHRWYRPPQSWYRPPQKRPPRAIRRPQPPKPPGPSRMVKSGGMVYYRRGKPKPPARPKPKSPWLQKPKPPPGVPARLTHQLELLARDKATAQRLVDQASNANPGKSRTWCTEKAIADLLRDRRR